MPEHLDFIKAWGLTPHALGCELSLIRDNLARLAGVNAADSLALAQQLLETLRCTFS